MAAVVLNEIWFVIIYGFSRMVMCLASIILTGDSAVCGS